MFFEFNKLVNNVVDQVAGKIAYMGSSEDFYPDYDINDPISIYERGAYFDGTEKYV